MRAGHDDEGPAGEVVIRELVAATPAARALLWDFLLDQDLTRTITWTLAPPDEPLWLMLTDPDAVRVGRRGRPVGAPRRRAGRARAPARYAGDPDVVLDVADAFCPWNAGPLPAGRRWLRAHATPSPTSRSTRRRWAPPTSAGRSLSELAAAGRVAELRPGALARASAAFRADVAPWCPRSSEAVVRWASPRALPASRERSAPVGAR